jgi:predicted nucleic acid-binding protein
MGARILADTSVLFAAAVSRESDHAAAASAIETYGPAGIGIPVTILAETMSLTRARYGLERQRALWDAILSTDIEILPVDGETLRLARDIDRRYTDAGLGFADATLLAACEQLRIARVLSFDRRLAAYRPTFAATLEVLP